MRGPAVAALCAVLLAGCGGDGDPPPQRLVETPDFELVDQGGARFGSAELRGRPWVANFVFTRCRTMCPRLSAGMARLRDELRGRPIGDELRLVSFSVDPEYDRPERLAEYASRYAADPERWSFLTGERQQIWELSTQGFKLAVGENPGDPDEPLFHSGKFVLVDRGGWIRGYYDALQQDGLDALLEDLRRLEAEDGAEG